MSSFDGSKKVGQLVQLEIEFGRDLINLNTNPYFPFSSTEYNMKMKEVVDKYLHDLNQEVGYGCGNL